MTERARFQVVEVKNGYAVQDTLGGSIWTKTYVTLGWAARKAVQLNEAHGSVSSYRLKAIALSHTR